MDTRLLEDALLLLEERNFSTAAARRNMTQPAFSRRIRTLEQWIGRDLLIRGPNRIEFSSTLAECEPQIRAMLAHLQQLRSQLQNSETNSEPLVIATQHSLSVSVVPEIVQKTTVGNPKLRVRLRTQNRDMAMSIFLRHEADILISYEGRHLPEVPFGDTVSSYVWRRDALIPIVGGDMRYMLSADNSLPKHSNIVAYPTESYFGQIISNYQQTQRLSLNGPVAVESAFSVGIVQFVLAGTGAAWLPHSMIYDEVISGDVVILSQDYGRIPLDITVYSHKSNSKIGRFWQDLEG
ncbi:MAG: LysR family transcriptional regulator [Gammaproteobacteria bacterium]|nr:LysR family transcriptional regulator [Gammaproteobacteria bacterium]